jgi:hypothetical protein
MAKPLPEKLNAGWQAAVKRMLATPPQPRVAVKRKPGSKKADRKRF